MIESVWASLALGAVYVALTGGVAIGQEAGAAPRHYQVKASDVVIPPDLGYGEYRRMTSPFENWTLICDEDLKKKRKVCNISQSIVDQNGSIVFSWSLAATEAGDPLMILRVPASVGQDKPVRLAFPGRNKPVLAKTTGCNPDVCVAMVPVGPILRQQIDKATTARISFEVGSDHVALDAPFKGLTSALAAIK